MLTNIPNFGAFSQERLNSRCCSLPTKTPNLLSPRSADRYSRPVQKFSLEISASIPLERADMVEIHYVRAVNTHKST